MSWDFSLVADLGGPEPVEVAEGPNVTYNLSPMFYDAFGGDGIRSLDGKTAAECKPLILAALNKMRDAPVKYQAMNPKNGWGDYEDALRALDWLAGMCDLAPLAKMRVH